MKTAFLQSSLNGWAETLFSSPSLYIAIGGGFGIVLTYSLWRLCRKPKRCPAAEAEVPKTPAGNGYACAGISAENCAGRVVEAVSKLNKKTKIILLAGAGLESLPITISVKAAIELAQSGKKCILVDLDTRRNAAAKVFDIHSDHTKHPRPKPIATIIENLSLWPAEFFVRFARMNLQHIVLSLAPNYEFVLINSPYLDGHPDRNLIAASADYGLIFCRKPKQLERLTLLFANSNCKLLDSKPANQ